MVYIITSLYIFHGKEDEFLKYEQKSLSIFRDNGGKVIAALRPQATTSGKEVPHEIHILSIPSMKQFKNYQNDDRILDMAEWRQQIVKKTELTLCDKLIKFSG